MKFDWTEENNWSIVFIVFGQVSSCHWDGFFFLGLAPLVMGYQVSVTEGLKPDSPDSASLYSEVNQRVKKVR